MNNKIVHSLEPIALVGGGVLTAGDFDLARHMASTLVAVDSGADQAVRHGIELTAVIGDLDSVSTKTLSHMSPDKVYRLDDQVTTDFDKALRSVAAPVVIALGFTGGRIDHQLAAFHTLVARADQPCILLGPEEIVFHAPPAITLDMSAGDVVSLFPLTQNTGRSTGLEWCIDGLSFDPATFIGTSNRALGPVHLSIDRPGMIVILPRSAIRQVVKAVAALGSDGRWPVL